MTGPLVVLTGASGSGKTTIARAIEKADRALAVFGFDTIGVPSVEVMATFGSGHQPGGAWQRAMTLQWFERILPVLASGRAVLFEGQMRITFVLEALTVQGISNARVILVDCDDKTRASRLTHDRRQAELANDSMMGWARYLRQEALAARCEVLDTGAADLSVSVKQILSYLS